MRARVAPAFVAVLGACQTASVPETVEIAGTLGWAGECGFLRTADGKLFDYYVPEHTRYGGRDTPARYTFPDGSIADVGKPYRFLVEIGKSKPICHETALTINRVLPP